MSHLLYLHAFTVERFVDVFGGGSEAAITELLATVPPAVLAGTTAARAKAVVTEAVMKGLDGKTRPAAEQRVLDIAVLGALWSKRMGIGAKPISSMGLGGGFFDAYAARFDAAKATRLFQVLQRGRNYETAFVLLSPADVALAAKQLGEIAAADDADDDDDGLSQGLREELVEPFTEAARKGRAVYGRWG